MDSVVNSRDSKDWEASMMASAVNSRDSKAITVHSKDNMAVISGESKASMMASAMYVSLPTSARVPTPAAISKEAIATGPTAN